MESRKENHNYRQNSHKTTLRPHHRLAKHIFKAIEQYFLNKDRHRHLHFTYQQNQLLFLPVLELHRL